MARNAKDTISITY